MSLALFNTEENLGKFEIFKYVPYELQDYIGRYIDENCNRIWNDTYDWNYIVDFVGFYYGWEHLIDFLNKELTIKIIGPLQFVDCRNITAFCHECLTFITCDEKKSIGFYYDYLKMPGGGKKYIWEEDSVDRTKATELIIDKINEYFHSSRYDPAVMYKINKRLLDLYSIPLTC